MCFLVIYDDFVIAKLSLLWFFGGFVPRAQGSFHWRFWILGEVNQKMEICWQGQFARKTRDFPWLIMRFYLNSFALRRWGVGGSQDFGFLVFYAKQIRTSHRHSQIILVQQKTQVFLNDFQAFFMSRCGDLLTQSKWLNFLSSQLQ